MIASNWAEANQRYLSTALAIVRNTLEQHIARIRGAQEDENKGQQQKLQRTLEEIAASMPAPAALTKLCAIFHLSPFERDLLLLCAGMEFDGAFAAQCAAAHGTQTNERNGVAAGHTMISYPTFGLALAALPGAHWDALTPIAALRRYQLIVVGASSTLTLSPLRIDERILHYLAGISYLDERLASIVSLLDADVDLVPSQRILAERLAATWSPVTGFSLLQKGHHMPVVQLCGEDVSGKYAIGAAACATLGLRLSIISANALPTAQNEIEILTRLWNREAALSECALLLDCDEIDMSDVTRQIAISRLVKQISGPWMISCRERCRLPERQPTVTFDVCKPSMSEQRLIWQKALGGADLNGHMERLVSQFNLSMSAIHAASAEVLGPRGEILSDHAGTVLWDACRSQSRPRLEDLAQRIEPAADWDDLVLPEAQQQILREIVAHVKQKVTVYETWGFAEKGARGLGISALFAGASGTGKTLAAEVLAHELRLDLYRIDLSSMVSKYIGETEKNLRRVFDAAEEGGAILLFDEADALFGKRSEVKDSHDRYANIEVSYLLQRMEAYRGLAILTTNLKSALDTAFLRRIRFIVQFPFPNGEQRAEIWRRIFPRQMPAEGLDMHKLARLNISGGNIRSIALNAAFLAAEAGEPVRMTHLLRAAHTEYAKLEKPLTEAEIGGWL